ncbi:MAG TPA: CinA family nicotinamide mononucleotide deamidase-related protein [Anaerolineales bacterium]|nr:CinA family nicotinamide mononucleotide deamidase-related protein [Anaerolineales bacterium]
MPTAEILTIGTELLLGETVDTNTRFIARTLRGLGVDLYRTQTVGDNAGRIAEAVREAMQRSQILITTGGLGPTVDDPTRQALADAVGVQLEFHPELWEQIAARIGRYGRTPTENQKRQAYLPQGAIAIENPVGTAPAFIVETPEGGALITLPGVPSEMETLLIDTVVPYLQKRYALHEVIKVRTLHVSGLGEGVIDDQVGDLETLANPTVGLTAHSGVVDIRIAAKAGTEADADGLIAKVEGDVRARMGANLFGADDDTLEKVTLEALARRGWSLATLEDGLDGGLQARLARAGHPAYRGGTSREVPAEQMDQAIHELGAERSASVVLGVRLAVSGEQQDIFIDLLTPAGREQRRLTYGGHPRNAARWAVNNALDGLRRIAQEAA